MKHYIQNWRTFILGVTLLIGVGLYYSNKITGEQLTLVSGVLTGFGLMAAQDSSKPKPPDNPFK